MNNSIHNFQNKSVISFLTCIKRCLKTQFEFNSEKVRFFYSGNLVIFNTVCVFVRLCRQRSGFLDLEGEINLHSYVQYKILLFVHI